MLRLLTIIVTLAASSADGRGGVGENSTAGEGPLPRRLVPVPTEQHRGHPSYARGGSNRGWRFSGSIRTGGFGVFTESLQTDGLRAGRAKGRED